ncbi:MAG: RraA family protein [Thermofilaceae archaeon]
MGGELIARFRRLRVADVVDALDRYGYHDNLLISREIRPLYPAAKLAGYAVTVRTRRVQEEIPTMGPDEYDRFADRWYATRANYEHFMRRAGPGTVIVVDASHSPDVGFWGSTVALHAKARGVEGAVIDGGVRDAGEIERIDFPTFYRYHGRTEVVGRLEFGPEDVNVPVTVGGVTVRPFDIVVGDYDGVVVVPREVAEKVLERAERQLELDRASQKPLLEKLGLKLW